MLTRPRLKQTVRVHYEEGGTGVLLVSETRTLVLGGSLNKKLLPLLDGTRTLPSLAAVMKPVNAKDVLGAVYILQREGFLVDAEQVPVATQESYWEHRGLNGAALRGTGIAARCFGQVSSDAFLTALTSLGFDTESDAPAMDVVITDDYLHPGLGEYGRGAQRPWLLVRPLGQEIWVGPLFVPGEGTCWECMAHRLRANHSVRTFAGQVDGKPTSLVTTENVAAHLAATQVAHWIAGQRPHPLHNTLFVWDLAGLTPQHHAVARRPQCPVCGAPDAREPQPLVLREGLRSFIADSGYRSVAVGETLQRLRRHVSPLTGIINRLSPVPDSDGLHVYTAKVYPPRPLRSWPDVEETERFYAGGKGTTADQAQVSALAEALERYSSRFHGEEPSIVASFAELGDRAIRPDALTLFSARQYEEREQHNKSMVGRMNRTPLPFDVNARIAWTSVWSLTKQQWRLIPTGFCYMAAPPDKSGSYCFGDSNGNAAGTSIEDAILQGFLELVERDAAAIWWYNRIPRPGVALDGIDDDFVARLTAAYAKIGRTFWLLDITNDFGIPTFVSISRVIDGPERMCSGMGSHYNPRVAALRALTEMNQLLPHILQHAQREDRQISSERSAMNDMADMSLAEHPYLAPASNLPVRHVRDFAQHEFPDLSSTVRFGMELVHGMGMEFLAHDLTRPDIGLPVAKVIVPGMRLHWRRAAPGRLYDVPVKLGWLARPHREEELNPFDLNS